MGICKCKRRTDLYCFVHNKPVCDGCILDHKLCHVRTYHEWLTSSEYNPPACAKCQQPLLENQPSLRLKCLDIFHPQCLEAHLQNSPADKVIFAGCPSCSSTIVPGQTDSSALAEDIRSQLEKFEFITTPFPRPTSNSSSPVVATPSKSTPSSSSSSSNATSIRTAREALREALPAHTDSPTVINLPSTPASSFTRNKPTSSSSTTKMSSNRVDMIESYDDKYGSKNVLDYVGIRSLLKRLKVIRSNPNFNRRALIVGVMILIGLFIWFLMSTLSGGEEENEANIYGN